MANYLSFNVGAMFNDLDDYMLRVGKLEIDTIEANRELERKGLLKDDSTNPGEPFRLLLCRLRDMNLLPQSVRQLYGTWKIKHSKTIAKMLTVFQF